MSAAAATAGMIAGQSPQSGAGVMGGVISAPGTTQAGQQQQGWGGLPWGAWGAGGMGFGSMGQIGQMSPYLSGVWNPSQAGGANFQLGGGQMAPLSSVYGGAQQPSTPPFRYPMQMQPAGFAGRPYLMR